MWKLSPLSRDCQAVDWKELSDRVDRSAPGKCGRHETREIRVRVVCESFNPSLSVVDLDMTVKFVDGDEVIADSSRVSGGILAACKEYEAYVSSRTASAMK
jgi:hypothetical protein